MWKLSLIAFFFCSKAWSYKLTTDFMNGFYWVSLPISITVIDSDASRKSTLTILAKDAVGEWESRTGLSLWDFDENGQSSNFLRWSNNFAAETGMDPTTVLAVAIRYTSGPYFAKTEIVVNGAHPLNKDVSHLLTTITHELGHTMGLDHSDNGFAVMAPTLQDPYRGLHTDDVQGMNYAYRETENRQVTRYVSPLAYEKTQSSNGLSCGTVSTVTAQANQGMLSLAIGMLIGFVRKIISWFKSKL